ncbi:ExbD/TolR family protein [Cesiribacter andamanensis]|uniref:Biopolymer transport protein ExbD/TolR n=1 Tax=Cesiribacter andamanensis AMV16 TaxID=1279009 RepID=M7N114_9BACT|nr:biopolymer transporter ExbD [Cesiribacter andamanensis]EMR00901.1 Biopolymer transport protein ExbD/TolR [Cesiribacter andamanensis AMV16]
MSKFKKKAAAKQEIPTSALPDIIFMLLFFFMVTTVMREAELKVEQNLPLATQLRKLEKKNLVSYLYIGKPRETHRFGSEPRIQVNDVFITPNEVVQFVEAERSGMNEADQNKLTMSMKVDKEAKMGLITDVQEELKKANALRVMYSTPQAMERD